MLVINQRHLDAILREYVAHDNEEPPHRSRGFRPQASCGDPNVVVGGPIRRNRRLGGLINDYRGVPEAG